MSLYTNIYNGNSSPATGATNKKNAMSRSRKKLLQRTENEETTKVKKRSRHTKRSSVSFDKTYEVCPSLSIDDYTPAELKACWYEDDEYNTIRRECGKVIKKMEQGKAINARKYCVRGLEKFTAEAQDLRELNQVNSFIAVLEEQSKQLIMGVKDPKKIAKEYRSVVAKRCQQEATKKGEQDALFVRKAV
jgi:hypothetical protein